MIHVISYYFFDQKLCFHVGCWDHHPHNVRDWTAMSGLRPLTVWGWRITWLCIFYVKRKYLFYIYYTRNTNWWPRMVTDFVRSFQIHRFLEVRKQAPFYTWPFCHDNNGYRWKWKINVKICLKTQIGCLWVMKTILAFKYKVCWVK